MIRVRWICGRLIERFHRSEVRIDHLLFLFGVIFFLTRFADVAKFVTAFTLGHCITLIFATFLGITWNYWLVDAVIALTVIYKGFDNNGGFQRHLDMKSPNMLGAVFAFGLIHGFGLSTRLQQLPLGEDKAGMLGRILSFNVGVELGQIAALTAMLVLLAAWRRRPSFAKFSVARLRPRRLPLPDRGAQAHP